MAAVITTTAASAAIDPDRPPPLLLDSIPTIDLRLFSQSELYSLSMSSSSSFDLNRCDDVVIPKINRSVFNESAGSRKQTYSRLRLAPAESSTSTKTSIHRRTPHLRSSHAHIFNNVNDPEQAENSQITRLLKELFKSDPNFEDLVPIEVENSTNVVVPELLNPEIKRKRGRPRKHENAVFIRPPAKRMRHNNTVKKEVGFDNDRDGEIMNSKGMKVNVMDLGRLEDPYGPEIRRRTEGMSTEDDLLGFLRGLNGQWGTRRKKKMVVDASDFGDALPKGWRLSLSIKKKEGRVWLFCRRYISPSGRQFESCMEVSMYLLSIVGEENLHKPSRTQNNDCDGFALRGASGNAAELFVCEDLNGNSAVQNPLAPSTSIPIDCEKIVKSDIVDPVDVQIVELFKCPTCFMIFEGKVDHSHNQMLTHKTEKSQLGSAISEWTVVKGGIFECWFCDKTFYERNQYNEHIGAHVTNEIETSGASEALAAENVVGQLGTGVPDKEFPVPVSAESNVVVETHDAHFGDKPISTFPENDHKISSVTESKINEFVHDLNMNGDALVKESGDEIGNNCNVDDNVVPGTDRAPDVSVSKSDFRLGHEASMSTNESNGKFENSGVTVDYVDDKLENVLDQGTSSGGCLLSPSSNKGLGGARVIVEEYMVGTSNVQDSFSEAVVTHVDKPECVLKQVMDSVGTNVVDMSAGVEVPHHAVSETRVQPSKICEKKGANINDTHICSLFDELTSENEKVVNSESSSGDSHGRLGLDEDRVAEAKKRSALENLSLAFPSGDTFSAANNAGLISFENQVSPLKVGFAGSTLAASVDQVTRGFDENKFSDGIESSKVDGQHEFRRSAFDSYYTSSMDGVTSVENEDNFGSHSSVPLWREKEFVNEDVGSRVPVLTMEEPRTQMNVESFQIKNDVKNVSSNKSVETKVDDFQIFRNNESINNEVASLGSSQGGFNTGVMAFNTGINLEFGFQDDVTGLYESAQESSERGLLDHFCVAETSDDIFRNKIYSTPLDGLKFDDDRGIGIHDLSLTFGNPHALYADTISLEQKKDGVHCPVIPSKIDGAFDVQTNLSMVNNSMGEDLKGGRESVGGSFSLSCDNETRAFPHNGNTAYPGRSWEDLRSDEFRSYGDKKFMVGSGSNQLQRNEVVPCGMWKTGQGYQLQSGLANPHAQIQPPSFFHSFDIMSDKADDGLFRLDERCNDNGLRSGRSEPVEFRFLTSRSEHNPDAIQGGSRVFPYNTGMEQAFDSNFWMGKNAMMPNMAGRNLVTSVCAWCGNEFPFQAMAIHPETQAGVGSPCPNCSAGFSGQINML